MTDGIPTSKVESLGEDSDVQIDFRSVPGRLVKGCTWVSHLLNIIAWILAFRFFQNAGWSAVFWAMVVLRVGSAVLRGVEATGGYLDRAVWLSLLLVPLMTANWLGLLIALALFGVWQLVAWLGMYSLNLALHDARARRAGGAG